MTTGEQWYAYAASRISGHPKTTRHAVDAMSHACGAADLECGRSNVRSPICLGEWDPGNPYNCVACTRALTGQS